MIDPNFVIIRGKFIPAEMFDSDREQKTMENPHDTPPVDEWLPDDDDLLDPELACPMCGEELCEYIGEAYDDEEHIGCSYRCDECGHEFVFPE